MKIRKGVSAAAGVLACCAAASGPAAANEVLYNSVGFLQGTQSFSDSFDVSSPGTLTVTLGNVGWPQPLSSLNMLVSSASGALGPEMGAGTATFNVNAGDIFAEWFGSSQGEGALNAGVYSLEIQFQPNSSAGGSTVPLPTSIALLLSGIGLLVWQRRTRDATGEALPGSASEVETA